MVVTLAVCGAAGVGIYLWMQENETAGMTLKIKRSSKYGGTMVGVFRLWSRNISGWIFLKLTKDGDSFASFGEKMRPARRFRAY